MGSRLKNCKEVTVVVENWYFLTFCCKYSSFLCFKKMFLHIALLKCIIFVSLLATLTPTSISPGTSPVRGTRAAPPPVSRPGTLPLATPPLAISRSGARSASLYGKPDGEVEHLIQTAKEQNRMHKYLSLRMNVFGSSKTQQQPLHINT